MRRASCRSVPTMCRPPISATLRPSAFIFSLRSISSTVVLPDVLGHVEAGVGVLVPCSLAQAIVSGLPPRMMSVPRPAMLVAIVTAPMPAGLGDDLGLAGRVVRLGVEHLVLDAARA